MNATLERSQVKASRSKSANGTNIILCSAVIKASKQSMADKKAVETDYKDIFNLENEVVLDPGNKNVIHPNNLNNNAAIVEGKKASVILGKNPTKPANTVRTEAMRPLLTLFLMNVPYVFQLLSLVVKLLSLVYIINVESGTCATPCTLNYFTIPRVTSCFNPILLLIRNREFQLLLRRDISRLLSVH